MLDTPQIALNRLVIRFLEKRPMFYGLIRPQEAYYFSRYRNYLKKPILDFGCGDGFFAEIAIDSKLRDIGLDIPSYETDSTLPSIYQNQITYDGKIIPVASEGINTVVSNSVLEHVDNLELCVSEIHRVMRPGGFFLTSVMTDKWSKNLIGRKILGNWYEKKLQKQQKHDHLLSITQWSNLFVNSGFKIIEVHGYLPARVSWGLEVTHYLSVSSLLTRKLFGKWVLAPGWHKFLGIDRLITNLLIRNIDVEPSTSSALFFVLQKHD